MSIPISVQSNRSQHQISASVTKNAKESAVTSNATQVRNSSEKHPQVAITTDKTIDKTTVHFADLNTLKNNVNDILKNMKTLLKNVSDNSGSPLTREKNTSSLKGLSSQLTKLKSDIQNYQNNIKTSSYKHNAKKPEMLEKFTATSKNADKLQNQIEQKIEYNTKLSKQAEAPRLASVNYNYKGFLSNK